MVGGAALAGIVGLGAVGGILANIALTPLTAGASLLQSYWYGSGLILGERMMYTVHWEKIKARLDKGETFMNVLDAEMNKDITAIAQFSFKAMDDTTSLFLSRASTTIAGHIETLLEAILNPFPAVNVETEPAPEGETTPEGISLTIEQIQAMSTNTLLFETQPSQITKYTEATQAHMLTEKLSRDVTSGTEEITASDLEATIQGLKTEAWEKEAQYLVYLTTTDFNMWKNAIFATSEFRNRITAQYSAVVPIALKQKTTTTDARKVTYLNELNVLRQSWIDNFNANAPDANLTRTIQYSINAIHTVIWLHQLIYVL